MYTSFFVVIFPLLRKKLNPRISRDIGKFCSVIPGYRKTSKIINPSGHQNRHNWPSDRQYWTIETRIFGHKKCNNCQSRLSIFRSDRWMMLFNSIILDHSNPKIGPFKHRYWGFWVNWNINIKLFKQQWWTIEKTILGHLEQQYQTIKWTIFGQQNNNIGTIKEQYWANKTTIFGQ